jgi:endonuclease/exonuclease/phosphatase family metal-dependent hydrolase
MASLTILSYNIHHCEGMDDLIDPDRIARVILETNPDLVAIQEIDRKTGRVADADQMAQLAELTGMSAAFARSIDYDGGEYGNVILTPHEILGTETIQLPGKEPRSAIRAEVLVPDAGQVSFICTHLTLIRDRQWDSVPLLNQLADDAPDGNPIILAGDFNTNPESATVKMLLESWDQAGRGQDLKSYPSEEPLEQIDYVFARPKGDAALPKTTAIAETIASDHRPLLATIALT